MVVSLGEKYGDFRNIYIENRFEGRVKPKKVKDTNCGSSLSQIYNEHICV